MNIQQLYYINLESRPDRRSVMEAMLAKHGVTANRFEAITPENPMVPPYLEQAQRLKPNEAACALSHFEVWKLIAKCERGTVACVLEDDVRMMTSKPIGK
jgi:GR25 family glycosyltransferase involved in LPS biosynthesis